MLRLVLHTEANAFIETKFKFIKMKRIRIMFLAVLTIMASSCATVYKNSTYEQQTGNLKTMAILPFEVHVKPTKSQKNKTIELDAKIQVDEGFRLQNEIYLQLLQKNDRLNATVQDISLTNAKLAEAGYPLNNLKSISKSELANLLGVDMILSGEVFEKKPVSTGGAIAIGAVSAIFTPVGWILPFVIPTNEVNMDINLHTKAESELLWKYHHTATGGVGSTPENIGNFLVKEVITKIPLVRKKKK
jgi:hypothetical protein